MLHLLKTDISILAVLSVVFLLSTPTNVAVVPFNLELPHFVRERLSRVTSGSIISGNESCSLKASSNFTICFPFGMQVSAKRQLSINEANSSKYILKYCKETMLF
jgi:hypothetical protein